MEDQKQSVKEPYDEVRILAAELDQESATLKTLLQNLIKTQDHASRSDTTDAPVLSGTIVKTIEHIESITKRIKQLLPLIASEQTASPQPEGKTRRINPADLPS
ncbi:hypothetical protein DGWBC_0317 [Dehalogenimonas sp. WBC-2]|nr:hypothetical protein DGWBC_0317 [Dehalogenimonas sp. WBC-2]